MEIKVVCIEVKECIINWDHFNSIQKEVVQILVMKVFLVEEEVILINSYQTVG